MPWYPRAQLQEAETLCRWVLPFAQFEETIMHKKFGTDYKGYRTGLRRSL